MLEKNSTDFNDQKINRKELARWLFAIGVRSGYQFDLKQLATPDADAALNPVLVETTDAALLESLQEVQRGKAELAQRLAVLQGQHDDREVLKQKASTLAKEVARLEGEKAVLQVELESLRTCLRSPEY